MIAVFADVPVDHVPERVEPAGAGGMAHVVPQVADQDAGPGDGQHAAIAGQDDDFEIARARFAQAEEGPAFGGQGQRGACEGGPKCVERAIGFVDGGGEAADGCRWRGTCLRAENFPQELVVGMTARQVRRLLAQWGRDLVDAAQQVLDGLAIDLGMGGEPRWTISCCCFSAAAETCGSNASYAKRSGGMS